MRRTWADLLDDCVWEVTRHLVSPRDYYALARCSTKLWALLTRADYAKPMTDTYFHSWRGLRRRFWWFRFHSLLDDDATVWTHEFCLAIVEVKGILLCYMGTLNPERRFVEPEVAAGVWDPAYDLFGRNGMENAFMSRAHMFRLPPSKSKRKRIPIAQTPALCLAAVKQDAGALEHVQIAQTRELCLAAVTQDGLALAFVSEKTLEICLAAIRQNAAALVFVPIQFQDTCREALYL